MKKLTMVLAICTLSILFVGFAYAQVATQTFNIGVNEMLQITTSGNPGAMIITTAVPGSDPTPVTDNSTTYSITHNRAAGAKITASVAPALAAGYTLTVALAGNAPVTLAVAAQDAVANVPAGALTGQTIAYQFSATAAAGALASTGETVTLTVVGL